MRLSRASAIAVFAITRLAETEPVEPRQGRDLAEELGVPADSLLKVLQQLVRSGLLISSRGRAGGFRLSRPPDAISLLDIVEAVDGAIEGRLLSTSDIRGMTNTKAAIEVAFEETVRSVRGLLAKTTVRDLMNHAT
jgi:Rrf2 family transcriptional regulator, cysteine metabolism repressor